MRRLLTLSAAGLLGWVIAEAGCDRRLEWQKRAGRLLEDGRCEEAIEALKVDTHEDSLLWHDLLVGAAMDCFRKTGDRAFVDLGLDRLNAALERRPESASLLHLKAFVLIQTGASLEANQLFSQAKKQAEANLAAGWSPDGLEADRRVLEDIRKSEARIGSERPLDQRDLPSSRD